jgi:hypothetical protein
MDRDEAVAILQRHLDLYRAKSYNELVALMGKPEIVEVAGASGSQYQLEVEVFWDDREQRNILVMGAIDDGGWRAFAPLTQGFIKRPDGSFVGE